MKILESSKESKVNKIRHNFHNHVEHLVLIFFKGLQTHCQQIAAESQSVARTVTVEKGIVFLWNDF